MTEVSETGFSLVSVRKMFVWLQELVVALMGQAWTKKDLQCLREVPAAARVALDAMYGWAYAFVRDSFADVFGQPALLTQEVTYRLIQRWEVIRQNLSEDEYTPYISSSSFKAAAYRHSCIGISFEHAGHPFCAVVELDCDAAPEFLGDCRYDLYLLDGKADPSRLTNSNDQRFESSKELIKDILASTSL